MKKKEKGPESWYDGYPALIWYSKKYGNNQIEDFAELYNRRQKLDKRLEKIDIYKKALNEIANNTNAAYRAGIDQHVYDAMIDIIGQMVSKIENQESLLGLDLDYVDAACTEWQQRENDKKRTIVDQYA